MDICLSIFMENSANATIEGLGTLIGQWAL